jgi:hypothetical protein
MAFHYSARGPVSEGSPLALVQHPITRSALEAALRRSEDRAAKLASAVVKETVT